MSEWPSEFVDACLGGWRSGWGERERDMVRAVLDAALAYRDADGEPVIVRAEELADAQAAWQRTNYDLRERAEAAEARVEAAEAERDAWRRVFGDDPFREFEQMRARVEALTEALRGHRLRTGDVGRTLHKRASVPTVSPRTPVLRLVFL